MSSDFFKREILKNIANGRLLAKTGMKLYKKYKNNEEIGACFLQEKESEQSIIETEGKSLKGHVLVFTDKTEWITEKFENCGLTPIYVFRGENFCRISKFSYTINFSEISDYVALFNDLLNIGIVCKLSIFYWDESKTNVNEKINKSIVSIFNFTKALMYENNKEEMYLLFINKREQGIINPSFEALEAFFKSLYLEDNKYKYKLVNISNRDDLFLSIKEFQTLYIPETVSYSGGIRKVKKLTKNLVENCDGNLFKSHGLYIICGGTGELGRIVAKYLAKTYQATIILIGKNTEPSSIVNFQEEIENLGGNSTYYKMDLTDKRAVEQIFDEIKNKNPKINGIIYCVGKLHDDYLINKNIEDIKGIVYPKVIGLENVDIASKNFKLDFFLTFSSMSAVLGIPGQCDYSYANSFCDKYMQWRCTLEKSGKRFGCSKSINWSIWKNSNMGLSEQQKSYICEELEKKYGVMPMDNEEGLIILENLVNSRNNTQCIPLYGQYRKIEELVREDTNDKELTLNQDTDIKNIVINLFSMALETSKSKITCASNLKELGIDSIMVHRFNNYLAKYFKNVPQTILYECKTVSDVIQYLETYNLCEKPVNNKEKSQNIMGPNISFYKEDDIAVIGMQVEVPGANNTEQFWENLITGKDSISDVPRKRWEHNIFYSTDKKKRNKTYCKKGGFIRNADMFDAAFFSISPREARAMDPQERLILQNVWHAIEDAGYGLSEFKRVALDSIGVFMGVTSNTYMLWADKQLDKGADIYPQSYPWSIANRVSYTFDFHGPSLAVDTACSSSLSALHLACQSLKLKECRAAVVGGVNLCLHPLKYIMQSNMNMLSESGSCNTFSENADGYVPSEGICSVILKPYKNAVEDKDNIYGIIKGTAINHGGASNGYTVPNPLAQKEVMEKALFYADIPVKSIGYIECHGTGTILGDPLEIEGIIKAYSDKVSTKCAIGSVKSNIGHTEAAAGILGLAKVLLQLKNKQLVPSINATPLNSRIDLKSTPFYVNQMLTKWERVHDFEKKEKPLCAGISSFGAGGANAHIVVQEHILTDNFDSYDILPVFVLSAKNHKALIKKAEDLIAFIEDHKDNYSFNEIMYSLQTTREFLEERLAFVANSIEEIKTKLQEFVINILDNVSYANTKEVNNISKIFPTEEIVDIESVINFWVGGGDFNFNDYYKIKHRKIKLPLYPFTLKHFWFDDASCEECKPIKNDSFNIKEKLEKFEINNFQRKVSLDIIEKSIAIMQINDPQNSNMLTTEVYCSLLQCCNEIVKNKEIKVVIITGGEKIFCMGGTPEKLEDIANRKEKCSDATLVFEGLLNLDIPVISAIRGHAMGGGLVLGLFADIIVMDEEGIYSSNFMKFGFTPGVGATYVLNEKLGASLSSEMMFTATEYTGKELKKRGVNFIFAEKEKVVAEAINIAKKIIEIPVYSLKVLKKELSARRLEKLRPIIESEVKMHDKIFSPKNIKDIEKRINRYYKHNDIMKDSGNKEKIKLCGEKEFDCNKEIPLEKSCIRDKKIRLSNIAMNLNNHTKISSLEIIKRIISKVLKIEIGEINEKLSFHELGFDSITAMEFIRELNSILKTNMETTSIYDSNSIKDFANQISNLHGLEVSEDEKILNEKQDNHCKVEHIVKSIISDILEIENKDEININLSFKEIGFDSITGMEFVKRINGLCNTDLETTAIYECKNITEFVNLVEGKNTELSSTKEDETRHILERMKAGDLTLEEAETYMEDIYGTKNGA